MDYNYNVRGIYEKVCVSIRGFELYIRLTLVKSYAFRADFISSSNSRICSTITHVSTVHHSNVAMMKID